MKDPEGDTQEIDVAPTYLFDWTDGSITETSLDAIEADITEGGDE